jgi:hypothetical protein
MKSALKIVNLIHQLFQILLLNKSILSNVITCIIFNTLTSACWNEGWNVLVPLIDGETKFAFKFNAANCALDTGLFASDILSTLPNPLLLLYHLTVPLKFGNQVCF